jgi:tetraacyldisaccharide 4'-kinase
LARKKYILLYPLALLYGAVTGIRNFLYNTGILRTFKFNIPIICVGNITVGGTGKTPHAEYLVELLRERYRVATLSRGYKRNSIGFRLAKPGTGTSELGDEPLQIFMKFPGIKVAVDRDRVHGVKTLIKDPDNIEVIILDDGFQHRRLTPGLTVLLTDYNRLMIRDFLLPFGELRESRMSMYRADIILITKSPEDLPPIQRRLIAKEMDKAAYQNIYFTTYKYQKPVPVFRGTMPGHKATTIEENDDLGILLVTGIANPDPLREYLEKKYREVVHQKYPDHHKFNERDIQKIADSLRDLKSPMKRIYTTEKDAVRLMEFTNIAEPLRSSLYYVPIGIHFLNDDQDEFNNLILKYVRKNKRNC